MWPFTLQCQTAFAVMTPIFSQVLPSLNVKPLQLTTRHNNPKQTPLVNSPSQLLAQEGTAHWVTG